MSNLKQKSIDGIIWNLLEKIGVQLVKLILGVILARLLTPADYGLIGMITVFISISIMFIDSGFGLAYIQKQDADDIDASTIFYFNLTISVFFFALLWFVAPFISDFYKEKQLVQLIRLLSIILVINSFGLIQFTKLTKDVDFKKRTILRLISAILSSTAGIAAALLNYGVWSLVVQNIAKACIENIGVWYFYKWRPLPYFSFKSLRSMMSFSLWALFMGILRSVFDNIYLIVIGKYFPAAQLGFYTKAKQFQQALVQTPSNAIGAVAFPVFSKLQKDKIALKKAMQKFSQHTIFFIAPMAAIFFVIAKPFFLILLTEKWLPMIPYFKLLLIAGVLYPIHMVNVQVLSAQGKMKLNFNISMIKNILRVINIMLMYKFGVIFIIYGEIILSFIALIINTFYSKRFVNYGMIEQLKDIYIILLTSIVLTGLGMMISNEITNDYLKVIVVIFFMGSFYLISMYNFNKKLLLETLNIIKSKLR